MESLDGFPEIHELTAGSLPLHFPDELQQENPTEAGSVIGVRGTLLRADHRANREISRMILARQVSADPRYRSQPSYAKAMETDRQIAQLAHRSKGPGYWMARLDLIDLLAASRSMEDGTVLPGTFARARRLLDTIPSGFPVPEIALDPDGEVAFDWIRSDRTMLSVSIGAEGNPSYAAGLADGTAYGFVRWGDTFPSALKDLLRRLYFPDG
ncbi:MAG: hypothetical protein OXL34_15875 [Gemmatimonadota bacterium]|nr:hypothetical protein [Gemmatimonadota bacterium]